MSKTGTDDQNGLHRAETAWKNLSSNIMNLEGIVKRKLI